MFATYLGPSIYDVSAIFIFLDTLPLVRVYMKFALLTSPTMLAFPPTLSLPPLERSS